MLPYLKAIVAGVGAFATGMVTGYADGALATGEVWSAVALTAGTVGAVWGVKNQPKADERGDINIGVSGLFAILACIALALVILVLLGADVSIFG